MLTIFYYNGVVHPLIEYVSIVDVLSHNTSKQGVVLGCSSHQLPFFDCLFYLAFRLIFASFVSSTVTFTVITLLNLLTTYMPASLPRRCWRRLSTYFHLCSSHFTNAREITMVFTNSVLSLVNCGSLSCSI